MKNDSRSCQRGLKKFEIKGLGGHARVAAEEAYHLGYHAYNENRWNRFGFKKQNPYPKGVRHDNWDRGYRHARNDHMMGRTGSTWN